MMTVMAMMIDREFSSFFIKKQTYTKQTLLSVPKRAAMGSAFLRVDMHGWMHGRT